MQDSPSWWKKHWKWFIPTGCFGCVGIVLMFLLCISGLVFAVLRGSPTYSESLQRAQSNPEVIEIFGEPITDSWFIQGSINRQPSRETHRIRIPLHGPKASGTLHVVAKRQGNEWDYAQMEVIVDTTGHRIDLLGELP